MSVFDARVRRPRLT